ARVLQLRHRLVGRLAQHLAGLQATISPCDHARRTAQHFTLAGGEHPQCSHDSAPDHVLWHRTQQYSGADSEWGGEWRQNEPGGAPIPARRDWSTTGAVSFYRPAPISGRFASTSATRAGDWRRIEASASAAAGLGQTNR